MSTYNYFATVPRNFELLLAEELTALGAEKVHHTHAGVHFSGPLEVGYRAVLWSRLANTVLLEIRTVPAATPEELYDGVRTVDWSNHMDVDQTLKVNFTSVGSEITHTRYGALKVKDGIVDQFRDKTGRRPSVQLERPDLMINCHVDGQAATLSIDLAGESLHRRGYRQASGPAPLKENVAAAVVMRAGWESFVRQGRPIFDPMCGSGTLLIEAAGLASDQAPGLGRQYFGLAQWKHHDGSLWKQLRREARQRAEEGKKRLGHFSGSDIDGRVIKTARANAQQVGLAEFISFERKPLANIEPPAGRGWPGLLITNAPYGERLGNEAAAMNLHRQLGQILRERFGGWQATILTGSKELGMALGLSADKIYHLYNGRLECLLLNIDIFER